MSRGSGPRPMRVPHVGLTEGEFHLENAALHYVTRVHRLRAGDLVTLFDVESGLEAEAELLDDRVGLVRVAACRHARATALPVTVLAGLGKGDKPEQVVRDAATLGAARVVFVQTERSIARAAGTDRGDRFKRVAIETSRQCGRGDVPEVSGPLPLSEVLVPSGEPSRLRLVTATRGDVRPLLRVVEQASMEQGRFPQLDLLIGPEGGLSPREVETALAVGFVPVGLGPLVLRTEVACAAALAALWLFADAKT